MRHLVILLAIAGSAGCLRQTEFKCTADTTCSASGAVCEATGYCSFTDPACARGRRYGDYAGSYSKQCVGDQAALLDGGVDTGTDADGQLADAPPSACPADYATLPNAGSHVYKLAPGDARWTTQRNRCIVEGAYLAVPDTDAELQALTAAAAAASTWVGIDDRANEGTFVTVQGVPATYLPWSAGEPTNTGNQGGEDCVTAVSASPNLATERCAATFPALCECDP